MNDVIRFFVILIGCMLLSVINFGLGVYVGFDLSKNNLVYDGVGSVAGTGSMLPIVRPDTLYSFEILNSTDELLCGNDYVYRKEDGGKVIHQFVYENEKGDLYFKGYNNHGYDDPVKRDQVIWHVTDYHFGGKYNESK